MRGRQEILELYLQDKPVANDVDINAIARSTPGFNGAGTHIFLFSITVEAACNISFCKRHEGYEGIVYFFSLPAASSWFSFVIYVFMNLNTSIISILRKKMLNMPLSIMLSILQ